MKEALDLPRAAVPSSPSPLSPQGRPLGAGPRVLALPITAALVLIGGARLFAASPELVRAFVGAGGALLLWTAALWTLSRRAERPLTLSAAVHRHHWVQACAQTVIMAWWGMHVRLVVAYVPLLLAQFVFAYGVDALLAWTRRGRHGLGFGPLPIVFSINLFLWFRPEWFHWQFVMILVGYLAKELIRWERDGRSAHIFNPSSFPLALAALALILTRRSDVTFGQAIATTQFYPPQMYLVIFLASLPGQFLFGVARMTLSAVLSLYAFSLVWLAATGTYFFYDSHIPLPVFLGMHLLFTDPSTSPRSEQGRILFGMIYAAGIALLYFTLSSVGLPTFYDKLLPVPIMNLMVRRIDALVASGRLARLDPARVGASLAPAQRHRAYTWIWVGVFLAMSALRGVGDRHPGQSLRFWLDACEEGSGRACTYAHAMTGIYCDNGSGWACNEWGVRQRELGLAAGSSFTRACELGYTPACGNVDVPAGGESALVRGEPLERDLPIVLRGSKPPLEGRDLAALRRIGCRQGWPGMCDAQES